MSEPDDRIIAECKERHKRVHDYEANWRTLFKLDVKFANADSDNGWQWDQEMMNDRNLADRPCLTVNKTAVHCLHIINDAAQNKAGISIRPVGDGASFEAAQVFEGLCRAIERNSNAQDVYQAATRWQVWGGMGYWRIETDYADDTSFDQEIFIRPILDPLSVSMDPDITKADGSDARYCILTTDMNRKQAEAEWPKLLTDVKMVDAIEDGWSDEDHVQVTEYFRVKEGVDWLVAFDDGSTMREGHAKEAGSEAMSSLVAAKADKRVVNRRQITRREIEWFKIVHDQVVERSVWAGKYIPIVRVPGQEVVVERKVDRRGHVRALKDPQRMYNFNTSAQIEALGLQSKIPYIGEAAAFEGYETYWSNANVENRAWLPFNSRDDQDRPIAAPSRTPPPQAARGYIEALQLAAHEMELVSGQYDATFGAPSNERSGKAIQERQRQGDNATYHFIDALATAIRFTGRIIVDLAPHIYDTPRVLRILTESGDDVRVQLDPQAAQAHQKTQQAGEQEVQTVFNPAIGRYDVEADVGPAFATRRQQAFDAFQQIASQNKELMGVIGDLMFKNADFPGADEIAERLRNMVPPQALGGPSKQQQDMQAQLQQAHAIIQQLQGELKNHSQTQGVKEALRQDQKQIDWYRAETERLKALGATDPEIAQIIYRRLYEQISNTPVETQLALHRQTQVDTQAIGGPAMQGGPPPPQPGAMQ